MLITLRLEFTYGGDNVADETFASFLSKKKEEARLSNTKLARIANISAVYLGEIINGKKIPQDKKTQYALADALNLSYEDRVMFFNLAASERGELPVDVYDYLLDNDDLISEIREKQTAEKIGDKNEKR